MECIPAFHCFILLFTTKGGTMSDHETDATEKKQGDIVIYQTEDGNTKIDVRFVDETVWLTQAQLVVLFQSSRANISEHIKNIYEEQELDRVSTIRNFRIVQKEGEGLLEHNQGS